LPLAGTCASILRSAAARRLFSSGDTTRPPDRFFWFDEMPGAAIYEGPGRCAMTLAKTPWYWETVTRNIALLADWREDFSIRHLVMPNHVECCTYPVLEWIAERAPTAPVSVMAQFHPDNFCNPASAKYRDKYAEIARPPTRTELDDSWRHARELGLKFEVRILPPQPASQSLTHTESSRARNATKWRRFVHKDLVSVSGNWQRTRDSSVCL
jgi:hypothetical protein